MNGVVLLSCYAVVITHKLWLISGLARCGNSITLPLPNLVAKLATPLRSVLCVHYIAIQMKAVFYFYFANQLLILSTPFVHQCVFDIRCADIYSHVWWQPMQSKHLPLVARCSLPVHRWTSIDLIWFCVSRVRACFIVHVDFSLNLRYDGLDRKGLKLSNTFSSTE